MDAPSMFPNGFHPCSITRDRGGVLGVETIPRYKASGPVRYYFIDFGLSRRYSPDDTSPLAFPIFGGDKTVPEFQNSKKPMNPFPTDIYYLGNLLREDLLEVRGNEHCLVDASLTFVVTCVRNIADSSSSKHSSQK